MCKKPIYTVLIIIIFNNVSFFCQSTNQFKISELIKNSYSLTSFQKHMFIRGAFLTSMEDGDTLYHYYYIENPEEENVNLEIGESRNRPTDNLKDTSNQHFTYVYKLLEDCYGEIETIFEFGWEYTEETGRSQIWIDYTLYEKITCEIPLHRIEKNTSIDIRIANNREFQVLFDDILRSSKFVRSVYREGIYQEFIYHDEVNKTNFEILVKKSLKSIGGEIYIKKLS
jgi:hypothetical protein